MKRVEETRSTMLSLNIVMTRDTVDSGVSHNALYVQYRDGQKGVAVC